MKRILYFLCLIVLPLVPAKASHILGGDLTYECLGNGQFRFTMTLFRDCTGISWSAQSVNLQGPVGGSLALVSSADVSPRCPTSTAISCIPPTTGSGPQGAVSRFVYSGIVNLSGLGPAPAMGYTWSVGSPTIPCCRPTNFNSASTFGTQALQVKMYPYTNPATGTVMTPAQICDNSPEFIDNPTATMILNPNDTVYYQNFALDPDLEDSTVFGIDFPLSNTLAPYPYSPPYSLTNPIPGIVGPPFIAAANTPINPVSGEMVLRPITTGTFVTVIKVSSFRCGQLISEVFRDVAFKVINNPLAAPPVFNPNAINPNNLFMQRAPIISFDTSVLATTYFVGDSIDFPVNVLDIYPSLTGNPNDPNTWQPANQGFMVVVNGNNVSPTNSSTNCPQGNGTCVTLSDLPDTTAPSLLLNPNGTTAGMGYETNTTQGGLRLQWVPGPTNLSNTVAGNCINSTASYQFLVTATDKICPVVGISAKPLNFHIRAIPATPPPSNLVGNEDSITHSVWLSFTSMADTSSIDWLDSLRNPTSPTSVLRQVSVGRRIDAFQQYYVYRATDQGAYQLIDSISDILADGYHDSTANLRQHSYRYRLASVSGLPVLEWLGEEVVMSRNTTSVFDPRALVLNLYPNPGSGLYTLEIGGNSAPTELELYDMKGSLLMRKPVQADEQKLELNLSQLAAGVYVLRMGNSAHTVKILHRP
ncbi:MAG: T9SS type A sorting domain-containing protein [Bacteroidia bacterium]